MQILRPDNIGDLSKTSGTTLSLPAGSYVTVGGQQYTNASALSLNTATTGAGGLDTGTAVLNSTYYVYGVVSAGALALVASLSASAPTGFTAYKQLGAYQTNNLAAIDFLYSTAQNAGEVLKDVKGVETRTSDVIFPGREYKNVIINGNFDVWQRTTSITNSGSGLYKQYSADRWNMSRDTGAVGVTSSRSTDVPTFAQSGFASQYSMLLTAGTGTTPPPGDSAFFTYLMEGLDYQQIHNRPVRLQFWVKSNRTGTFTLTFGNNTINFGTSRRYMTTYTINAANTWEKKTIDITMDNAPVGGFGGGTGYESGNQGALFIDWGLQAGTTVSTTLANQWTALGVITAFSHVLTGSTQWGTGTGDTFQLAQVSLLVGQPGQGIDVPFSRAGRTIQDEEAMCLRYFQRLNSEMNAANGLVLYSQGIIYTATSGTMLYKPLVPMRTQATVATPNLTNLGVFNNAGVMVGLTSLTLQTGDGYFLAISFGTASGLTGGNVAAVGNRVATAADITFNAEI